MRQAWRNINAQNAPRMRRTTVQWHISSTGTQRRLQQIHLKQIRNNLRNQRHQISPLLYICLLYGFIKISRNAYNADRSAAQGLVNLRRVDTKAALNSR
jgi:hypothetical protein